MLKKTLLLNYVYWPPVGHAIEALRYSLGYHLANPDLEISLVLNKHTAYQLADLCPWIKKTYTVPVYPVDSDYKSIAVTPDLYSHIPRDWDYVISDDRSKTEEECPGVYFDYYEQTKTYWNTPIYSFTDDKSIPYTPHQQLILTMPDENKKIAETKLLPTKVKIAVLLAGNKKPHFFPSLRSWRLILDSLYKQYPDLSVYFIGKLNRAGDRSSISGISRDEIDALLSEYPASVDCFDMGLFNQLALIHDCDIFLSPHSGFGFAALAVGTSWLTISGGRWAEYFYNGVPFYSVLPDREKYPVYEDPSHDRILLSDPDGRIPCMSYERIQEDLGEIVKGADILGNRRWTYEECLTHHFVKMLKFYRDRKKIYSFDNLHEKYI